MSKMKNMGVNMRVKIHVACVRGPVMIDITFMLKQRDSHPISSNVGELKYKTDKYYR